MATVRGHDPARSPHGPDPRSRDGKHGKKGDKGDKGDPGPSYIKAHRRNAKVYGEGSYLVEKIVCRKGYPIEHGWEIDAGRQAPFETTDAQGQIPYGDYGAPWGFAVTKAIVKWNKHMRKWVFIVKAVRQPPKSTYETTDVESTGADAEPARPRRWGLELTALCTPVMIHQERDHGKYVKPNEDEPHESIS